MIHKINFTLGIALSLLMTGVSLAKVDQKEAARLGKDLTPLGAVKAGNKAGTIPAWTGGIQAVPKGYKKGMLNLDPYPDDKVKFTINGENYKDYSANLSPGQIAMFERYPKTFKLVVYPTRRSASYPEFVYEASKGNALTAELSRGGNGVANAAVTSPFPIPKDGTEAIWNHLLRYRSQGIKREVGQVAPTSSGKYTMVRIEETVFFPYHKPGATVESVKNRLAYFLQTVKSPNRLAGNILLVHETLDQNKEPRLAWTYNPGQRRVRRAPNIAFDYPGTAADNQRTTDQSDIMNGSPERYNWELKGRKEMYVPYNAYKLHSKDTKPADVIKAGHLDSNYLRYELHRVWEVEGTIKKGTSHIYAKKTYYLDEDTWGILVADQYDGRGNIWRVSEAHNINYYEVPVTWDTLQVHYDVINGRYLAYGFNNGGPVDEFGIDAKKKDFTPQTLRRKGMR
jgi:hypothetical protein